MSKQPPWSKHLGPQQPSDAGHPRVRPPARGARPALEILDVRLVPTGGVSATYNVTQDWGSGFQARMSLVSTLATSVADWKLEFDLKANISSIWDARVVSHTGNHYLIRGASYDADLPAG